MAKPNLIRKFGNVFHTPKPRVQRRLSKVLIPFSTGEPTPMKKCKHCGHLGAKLTECMRFACRKCMRLTY